MAKFRREGGKSVPQFNASSMSDIIFMFLFFTNFEKTKKTD